MLIPGVNTGSDETRLEKEEVPTPVVSLSVTMSFLFLFLYLDHKNMFNGLSFSSLNIFLSHLPHASSPANLHHFLHVNYMKVTGMEVK